MSAPSTKRKRTAVACRRCNQQRIRCDAASVGLPCTSCRRVGNLECQFIHTKRARGSTGRFTSQGSIHSTEEAARNEPECSDWPRASSIATARAPEYEIDFEELCRDEPRDPRMSTRISAVRSNTNTCAESWYLSYVVQTTSNDHDRLFGMLGIDSTALSRTAAVDRGRRSGATFGMRELPAPEMIGKLLDAYFAHFHAFCPLLDERWVRSRWRTASFSAVLLRCILFISSIHCDVALLRDLGFNDRIEAQDSLFRKAKAAFDSDEEGDSLIMFYCSYLLHYWSGNPSSFKDSLWWLAGAIRAAQSMGMHRSAKSSAASTLQRRCWRKIWWLLYIRDRQISISLGKPFLINDGDCDVEVIEEDDLLDEVSDTRQYVLEQVRLSVEASKVFPLLSPCSSHGSITDSARLQNTLVGLSARFDDFRSRLQSSMSGQAERKSPQNLILQMNFEYYKILAYRTIERRFTPSADAQLTTMHRCTKAIVEAAGNVTSLLEEMLASFEAQQFPMICVSAVFAAMTVQFIYSKRPDLVESRDRFLDQLRFALLGLKEFEDCHRLAHWIRKLFLRVRDQMRRQSSLDETCGGMISDKPFANGDPCNQTSTVTPAPRLETGPSRLLQPGGVNANPLSLTEQPRNATLDILSISGTEPDFSWDQALCPLPDELYIDVLDHFQDQNESNTWSWNSEWSPSEL